MKHLELTNGEVVEGDLYISATPGALVGADQELRWSGHPSDDGQCQSCVWQQRHNSLDSSCGRHASWQVLRLQREARLCTPAGELQSATVEVHCSQPVGAGAGRRRFTALACAHVFARLQAQWNHESYAQELCP